MSHRPHLGHRYRDRLRIHARERERVQQRRRVTRREVVELGSIISGRSAPIKLGGSGSRRNAPRHSKVRDVRFPIGSHSRTESLYTDDPAWDPRKRCRHSGPSNRATRRLVPIRPAGRGPRADVTHAAGLYIRVARLRSTIPRVTVSTNRRRVGLAAGAPKRRSRGTRSRRGVYRLISHCSVPAPARDRRPESLGVVDAELHFGGRVVGGTPDGITRAEITRSRARVLDEEGRTSLGGRRATAGRSGLLKVG